jgi:hypothetical protein
MSKDWRPNDCTSTIHSKNKMRGRGGLLYLDIFLRCEMRGWFKTLSAIAVLVLVQGWIWTTWDVYNILFQQNTLHFMQNHPALSFYFCYESSMCNHLVVSLWTSKKSRKLFMKVYVHLGDNINILVHTMRTGPPTQVKFCSNQ